MIANKLQNIFRNWFSHKFATLGDRMLYYRSKTDYRLPKKSYVIVMLDGKNFSTKVKKKFKRPFDETFIDLMNETAAYVCSQVQGAKVAYVQSDEISIVITDFEEEKTTPFFDFRLCKMQSIIPALATSFFNKEILRRIVETPMSQNDMLDAFSKEPLYQFDCKVWTVPTFNDVVSWFLFRQNDCQKNSKNQTAQTYLSHKKLLNKTTDEQIALLKEEKNIDWYGSDFNDGERYGRFIYKEMIEKETVIKGEPVKFMRSVWKSHYAQILNTQEGRQSFLDLNLIPQKEN